MIIAHSRRRGRCRFHRRRRNQGTFLLWMLSTNDDAVRLACWFRIYLIVPLNLRHAPIPAPVPSSSSFVWATWPDRDSGCCLPISRRSRRTSWKRPRMDGRRSARTRLCADRRWQFPGLPSTLLLNFHSGVERGVWNADLSDALPAPAHGPSSHPIRAPRAFLGKTVRLASTLAIAPIINPRMVHASGSLSAD